MKEQTKRILVPVDGSKSSLRALEYLPLMYLPQKDLNLTLLYILPKLPRTLIDEEEYNRTIRSQIKSVEEKHVRMAEQILAEAKEILIEGGFKEGRIRPMYNKIEATIPKDICHFARSQEADAILLGRWGRTEVKNFFVGEICDRLVECCEGFPLWIMGSKVDSKKVLVCVDGSANALRAVEHAGLMLGGTDCEVTLFHTITHLRRFLPIGVLEGAYELKNLWKEKSEEQISTYMEKAIDTLLNAGVIADKIVVKTMEGTRSPANDILNEALRNGYGTVVLGRRGISMVNEFFMGSVTKKILLHLNELAVWIVH
ncbi:MAG: universal stress protein [Thermodesulfobacteriota bacterium]|nr:universal stress protein [Thermodesulfobacteriota bacterium]